MLLSRLHFDHVDLPSLRMLDCKTSLIVSGGGGRLLWKRGFGCVMEMEAGEEVRIGSLTVRAEHPGARSLLGPGAPALGCCHAADLAPGVGVRVPNPGETLRLDTIGGPP